MGLSGALFTGLSGMTTSAEWITLTGNNIANVNTAAFKSSRMGFETEISQLIRAGSAPSTTSGGRNPAQVGLGTRIGSVTRNFNTGSLQPTGVASDLAIQGDGFFVVDVSGSRRYTRDGHFSLDANYNLVNPAGGLVQGYGIDSDYSIVEGVLDDIRIPVGILTIAEATSLVKFKGNLKADGDLATQGSINLSSALYTAGAVPALATDDLDTLEDVLGTSICSVGDVLTVSGATKGDAILPDRTFEVGATNTTGSDANGTTLQDFMDFLDDVLGIDNTVGAGVPGVVVNGSGQIVVTGNDGTKNQNEIGTGTIRNTTTSTSPFSLWTTTQDADGESIRTTFTAYDSLGTAMTLEMTIVAESRDSTGQTWRFYVQSADDSDVDRVIGNGTITFDTDGNLLAVAGNRIYIDLDGTGATTPQQIDLAFTDPEGSITAKTTEISQIAEFNRDGTAYGVLEDYAVQGDGVINGRFSNGESRDLGRIPLATFANNNGLVDEGGNIYNISSNAGTPVIGTATTGGAGEIFGGTLELSNVELSAEFINLISASTGFTANSRVITTAERLIQELLASLR